jgi:hypothetical protein
MSISRPTKPDSSVLRSAEQVLQKYSGFSTLKETFALKYPSTPCFQVENQLLGKA